MYLFANMLLHAGIDNPCSLCLAWNVEIVMDTMNTTLIQIIVVYSVYSGTSLIRTPWSQVYVSRLTVFLDKQIMQLMLYLYMRLEKPFWIISTWINEVAL